MSFETHCSVIGHSFTPYGDLSMVCERCGQYVSRPRLSDRFGVNAALGRLALKKARVAYSPLPKAPEVAKPSRPFLLADPRHQNGWYLAPIAFLFIAFGALAILATLLHALSPLEGFQP